MAKTLIKIQPYMKIMYKVFHLLAICSITLNTSQAQDFENFKPLTAQGTIPQEFITLSSEKYTQQLDKLQQQKIKEKRYEKKAKKEFTLKNSFDMKDYLFSGRIIFNDPISLYINKVADEILKTEPDLKGKVKFLTIRSADVNAFATHEGLIFVNEGMIAQLENEAQLAFVLCHELVHYKKNHVMNSYVEGVKIARGKTEYKSVSDDNKFYAKNRYSRELETEADIDGFEIFLKTKYSAKPLSNFFDVLQYCYLPFDDIVFEKNFLETSTFKLPNTYFLDIIKGITVTDGDNDEKSTHPSIKNRRAYIAEKIKRQPDNKDKKEFIVSESEFLQARKIARFDISAVELMDVNYASAFYNSYLLLQEDKENLYLRKSIAKSLYAMTKYANENKLSDVLPGFENIEGNSQQVYHLFSKLKPQELNAIALKYCWNLSAAHPDQQDLKNYTDDLFKSLVFNHYPNSTLFSFSPFQSPVAETETDGKKSKYQKIKSVQDSALTEDNFIKYVFVDELASPDFQKKFDELAAEKRAKDLEKSNETEIRKKKKEKRRENRLVRKKGYALGIDKIVVINPFYQKKDLRKKNNEKYFSSENAELRLNERITNNAEIAHLDVEVINDLNLTTIDIQKYNDMSFMTMWLQERVNHLDNDVKMLNIENEYVDGLTKRYNTPYFSWMGVVGMRERKENAGLVVCTTILIPYILPYTIYYIATPNYDTYYVNILFDIKTGEPKFAQSKYMNARDSKTINNMNIYDSFYQIKTSRKK